MKGLLLLSLILLFCCYLGISQQNFDPEHDFLLLHNDTQADPDDIHSIAAVACFLQHPDRCGVRYFGVIGTNKGGNPNFLPRSVEIAKLVYGTENVDWANANKDFGNRIAVRDLVAKRVKPILDNGGKIWVAEAGQADFTYDVVMRLKDMGVAESQFKTQIVIVQHSEGNEKTSTDQKLNYLRANTDYRKIDNGNLGGNNTPAYVANNKTFLNEAKSVQNPNPITREYWTVTDNIVDAWNAVSDHKNNKIRNGGVDFSDATEVWYMFNLGNTAWTVRNVWDNYVLREPTDDPCDVDPGTAAISFQSPINSQFEEGVDLGIAVSVDQGNVSDIKLYLNDQLVRQENAAPYQWGVAHQNPTIDPILLNMNVGEYTLKAVATGSRGVMATETKIINVGSALSIDAVNKNDKIRLYPNPVQNTIHISRANSDQVLKIFNVQGAEIKVQALVKGENRIQIDALPSGIYFVKIKGSTNGKEKIIKTYKLVKQE